LHDCVIFSIGSNNQWDFEHALHQVNPRCEIFTFDHTVKNARVPLFVKFFPLGLGASDSEGGSSKTLRGLMEAAGVANRSIDILKIDCEGCELNVASQFSSSSSAVFIRQILVEMHINPWRRAQEFDGHPSSSKWQYSPDLLPQLFDRTHEFFESMRGNGYVIFHKEPNLSCDGRCVEYSFINLNLNKSARAPARAQKS
jgi:hypothetical protein